MEEEEEEVVVVVVVALGLMSLAIRTGRCVHSCGSSSNGLRYPVLASTQVADAQSRPAGAPCCWSSGKAVGERCVASAHRSGAATAGSTRSATWCEPLLSVRFHEPAP